MKLNLHRYALATSHQSLATCDLATSHRPLATNSPATGHQSLATNPAAFTLIELLVVISILGILATLSAGAFIRFRGVQQQNNTETMLKKINPILNRHWQAVVDQANKEKIPANVMTIANNDPNAARAVYIKLRLRQEFPQSFAEILDPAAPLPAIASYKLAAARGMASPNHSPATESAACLLMALERGRGGSSWDRSDLGASAVVDTDGDGVAEIVDGWIQPVAFIRWPYSDPYLNPGAGPQMGTGNDRDDPQGFLANNVNWKNWLSGNLYSITQDQGKSYKLMPIIVSAGVDGKMGLDYSGGASSDANDNIYSHSQLAQ